ncbi:uncharacterized protein LOC132724720, partial [Ruditapes philippinarum]|uniref:uncharacterized protein LOC132724720 n=1 Tax=Ruditapes philippinarum TaxID=129788 RepID=UPI00295A872C
NCYSGIRWKPILSWFILPELLLIPSFNFLGPVYEDCACGRDAPKNVTTQRPVVTAAIPNWCFSPSGTDCSWYKDCLEKRYPCKEHGNSYALDYAEKFCNLYQDHYEEFNNIGQEWIDAVRKCLQVKLVPILRPFVMATCESIRQQAFESHSGCYLHPDVGKPSICDIGGVNWARIFWTVKSALIQDATATLKQMLDVVEACGSDILSTGMEKIQMIFRQTTEIVLSDLNQFAESISEQIASQMDWYKRGIIFFGFPTFTSYNRFKRSADNKTDLFYINLLIASKSEFDLNANSSHKVNVSTEATSVAKAIENGDARLQIPEGTEFTELSLCVDYSCTETSLQIKPAPPEKKDGDGVNAILIIIIVCSVTFGIALIVSVVVILRKFNKC